METEHENGCVAKSLLHNERKRTGVHLVMKIVIVLFVIGSSSHFHNDVYEQEGNWMEGSETDRVELFY